MFGLGMNGFCSRIPPRRAPRPLLAAMSRLVETLGQQTSSRPAAGSDRRRPRLAALIGFRHTTPTAPRPGADEPSGQPPHHAVLRHSHRRLIPRFRPCRRPGQRRFRRVNTSPPRVFPDETFRPSRSEGRLDRLAAASVFAPEHQPRPDAARCQPPTTREARLREPRQADEIDRIPDAQSESSARRAAAAAFHDEHLSHRRPTRRKAGCRAPDG